MNMKSVDPKYAKAFASAAKNNRQALAQMIIELLDPNHITVDYISMLLNTRQLAPGDQLFKRLRKGAQVRTLVPGSIHLSNEITVEDRAWYNLSGVDIRVHVNEWDLESGQIGTMADIESEMRAEIADYYQNRVISSLATLWDATNTPDNYTSVGGTLTSTALEAAIDQINQTTPGAKAVIGIRKLLTPVTKFNRYVPYGTGDTWGVGNQQGIDDFNIRGMAGTYYGTNIIALDQVYDNPKDYNALLPTDKVLVIGEDVGEFITYGDVKTKQWTNWEPSPPVFNVELYQQYGMIIWNQMGIYVIGGLS